MTAQEFRDTLERLRMSQRGCSRFLGVNEKTVRDWADTRLAGPPAPVAKLLRLMVAKGLTPGEVDLAIGA